MSLSYVYRLPGYSGTLEAPILLFSFDILRHKWVSSA